MNIRSGFTIDIECNGFASLAVTLCRDLNIPARYYTTYFGNIGVPADLTPMDCRAWFKVFCSGLRRIFDARYNMPWIGRIMIARGRNAIDVRILHMFGSHRLKRFKIIIEEIGHVRYSMRSLEWHNHDHNWSSLKGSKAPHATSFSEI